MHIKTTLSLVKTGRARLLWTITQLFDPYYRLSFLAAAISSGTLERLAGRRVAFDDLARDFAPDAEAKPGFKAWLDVGVRLGELEVTNDTYFLRGYLAKMLAKPENDEVAALVQEIASFHHRLILESPARFKEGKRWTLAEHDAEMIARSSRIMEPFMFQAIDWAVPAKGPLRLLEIGCGAGTYLRYAAERNPEISGVGIELDPVVAESTSKSMTSWGLERRFRIEMGDVRNRQFGRSFDIVTLYNVIYYFPRAERNALFAELASFLRPGGKLIVTTSCRGGSVGMRMLDVWTSSTSGLGPLPTPDELIGQLREAGFVDIQSKRIIPGEPHYAFVGYPNALQSMRA